MYGPGDGMNDFAPTSQQGELSPEQLESVDYIVSLAHNFDNAGRSRNSQFPPDKYPLWPGMSPEENDIFSYFWNERLDTETDTRRAASEFVVWISEIDEYLTASKAA